MFLRHLPKRPGKFAFLFSPQWFIAVQHKTPNLSIGSRSHALALIEPAGDSSFADPFLVNSGDQRYVFFENFNYMSRRGTIDCMELDSNGRPVRHKVVLADNNHFSYPFIFTHEGSYFMIPEAAQTRSIPLYIATEFPWRWKYQRKLIGDIAAVDSTMFFRDGLFWLFTTQAYELYVFHAKTPFGPWTAHRGNPVVKGRSHARCAGAVFEYDGRLIRPAQDCVDWYGHFIRMQEIVRLNQDEYWERDLSTRRPSANEGICGIHTYNCDGDWEVWDGFTYGCLPAVLAERSRRMLTGARDRAQSRARLIPSSL